MKTIAFLFTFSIIVAAQHAGAENTSPLPSDASSQPAISFENYEKKLLKEDPIEPLDGEEKKAVAAHADGLEAKAREVEQAFEPPEELAVRVLTASEEFNMQKESLAKVPSEMKMKPAFERDSLDRTDINADGDINEADGFEFRRKDAESLRWRLLARDEIIVGISSYNQPPDSDRKELADPNRPPPEKPAYFCRSRPGTKTPTPTALKTCSGKAATRGHPPYASRSWKTTLRRLVLFPSHPRSRLLSRSPPSTASSWTSCKKALSRTLCRKRKKLPPRRGLSPGEKTTRP